MKKRGGLLRRAASAALAVVLVVGLCPAFALAGPGDGLSLTLAAQDSEHPTTQGGWVYVSVSDDGLFAVSDGEVADQTMWRVPIDLADVSSTVDLDKLGLGGYEYDKNGDGVPELTLLHVMIYLNKVYCAKTDLEVSGGPRSAFINGLFGYDINLNYYVNGEYVLDSAQGAGVGATADIIELSDGDFIDIAHYSDYDFYNDELAGFRYFYGAKGSLITSSYVAQPGKPFTATLQRVAANLNAATTRTVPEAGSLAYYSTSLDREDQPLELGKTAADGTISVTFDNPGIYYLYSPGTLGQSHPKNIVNTPAYVRVYVTADTNLQRLITAIDQARRALSGVWLSAAGGDDVAPNEQWVNQAAYAAFKTAIVDAQATLDKIPSGSGDAQGAIDKLTAAKSAFEQAVRPGTTPDAAAYLAAVEAYGAEVLATKSSTDGSDVLPSVKWTNVWNRNRIMTMIYDANALIETTTPEPKLADSVSVRRAQTELDALGEAMASFRLTLKAGQTPDTASLSKSLTAADSAKKGVKTSTKSGKDVLTTAKWTTKAALSKLNAAIASAKDAQTRASAGKATAKEVAAQADALDAARAEFSKAVKSGLKVNLAKPALVAKSTKSAAKGKVTAAWKKVANAAGYQLKVGSKTYTVKGANTLKKTVSAKKGAKVKVQVRAYKKVGTYTNYSPWSASKTLTVKK